MIQIASVVWPCAPTIAACQIIAVSWLIAPPLISEDLTPDSQLHKTIRVFTADEIDLLYANLTMNNRAETRVEFLLADRLAAELITVAKDFIDRVMRRAEVEGLTRRPIGFRRV